MLNLKVYNCCHTHAADNHQQRDQGDPQRQFVANYLGCGSQATQERIFVVGRPASQHYPISADAGHCGNVEQTHIYIGHIRGNRIAKHFKPPTGNR